MTTVRHRFYQFFPHGISPSRCTLAVESVRLIAIDPEFFVLQHRETQQVSYARRFAVQWRDVSAQANTPGRGGGPD